MSKDLSTFVEDKYVECIDGECLGDWCYTFDECDQEAKITYIKDVVINFRSDAYSHDELVCKHCINRHYEGKVLGVECKGAHCEEISKEVYLMLTGGDDE